MTAVESRCRLRGRWSAPRGTALAMNTLAKKASECQCCNNLLSHVAQEMVRGNMPWEDCGTGKATACAREVHPTHFSYIRTRELRILRRRRQEKRKRMAKTSCAASPAHAQFHLVQCDSRAASRAVVLFSRLGLVYPFSPIAQLVRRD